MGGMYGGMPGMYGGLQPSPFDPMNPSLTQTLESTTQHTFALLHSIVQTFSGVAQMLESTFMATHSSFFAMVGVVDQFGQLRNALGSVLGLFGLVRWMRELLTGTRGQQGQMRGEFRDFLNGRPAARGPYPRDSQGPCGVNVRPCRDYSLSARLPAPHPVAPDGRVRSAGRIVISGSTRICVRRLAAM